MAVMLVGLQNEFSEYVGDSANHLLARNEINTYT